MRVYYADGGCLNNGTTEFYAYGSYCAEGMSPRKLSFRFDEASTSNQAEYMALISLLKELQSDSEMIEIRMDSQLIVNQVNGSWRINSPILRRLHQQARELINKRKNIVLKWVPRKQLVNAVGH